MLERVLKIDDKVRCEAGWLTFADTAEEVFGHKSRIKLDSKNQKKNHKVVWEFDQRDIELALHKIL